MEQILITRDDVIRGGACPDGVYAWAYKHAPGVTALPLAVALRKAVGEHKDYLRRSANLDGYGDGDGDGDGNGNGYGNGYGYGNGDGDGNGNGNGYGYGYGDGDGGFEP